MQRIIDSYVIVTSTDHPETHVLWGDESNWTIPSTDPKEQAKLYRTLAAHMLDKAFYLENDPEIQDPDLAPTGKDRSRQIQAMAEENPIRGEEVK